MQSCLKLLRALPFKDFKSGYVGRKRKALLLLAFAKGVKYNHGKKLRPLIFFQVLYRKEIRSFLQHNVEWHRPLAHKKDSSIFREVA